MKLKYENCYFLKFVPNNADVQSIITFISGVGIQKLKFLSDGSLIVLDQSVSNKFVFLYLF